MKHNITTIERFAKGELFSDNLQNIYLYNLHIRDWIAELSEYIDELNPNSSLFGDSVISFLSSVLDIEKLTDLIGEPIYHNHYGEGFVHQNINYDCASWVYPIKAHRFSLLFNVDHSGTKIYVISEVKIENNMESKLAAVHILFKKFADNIFQKNR